MIVPNRDIRNIHFLSLASTSSSAQISNLPPSVVIDVDRYNVIILMMLGEDLLSLTKSLLEASL